MYDYYNSRNTQRLTLQRLDANHISAIDTFLAYPENTRLFPSHLKPPVFTGKDWYEKQLSRYRKGTLGLLALIRKSDHRFVGQCGLLIQSIKGQEYFEVGYHLLKEFQGLGYATEAASYLVREAFEKYEAKQVIALIHPENQASKNVAKRIGMHSTNQIIEHHGPSEIFQLDRREFLTI